MDSPQTESTLDTLREELDDVDQRWLEAIADRMKIVRAIKREKERLGKPVFDRTREREIVEKMVRAGREHDVDDDVTRAMMEVLFAASHALQGIEEDEPRSDRARARITMVRLMVSGCR